MVRKVVLVLERDFNKYIFSSGNNLKYYFNNTYSSNIRLGELPYKLDEMLRELHAKIPMKKNEGLSFIDSGGGIKPKMAARRHKKGRGHPPWNKRRPGRIWPVLCQPASTLLPGMERVP